MRRAPPDAPVEPRAPTEAERKAASEAIEAQLKAFKADDYKKAEKYQSSGLRQNFRSTDEFRDMICRQFDTLYREGAESGAAPTRVGARAHAGLVQLGVAAADGAGDGVESGEAVHEGGFAGAGGSHDGGEAAAFEFGADAA